MKKVINLNIILSFLIAALLSICSINSTAQIKQIESPAIITPPPPPPPDDNPPSYIPFVCNPSNLNPCNLILNNTFIKNPPDPNNPNDPLYTHAPFVSYINYWTSSHGTPQLNVQTSPITANVNHASMWVDAQINTNGNIQSQGEGIAIGIPRLTTNNTYSLSFSKVFAPAGSNSAPDIDDFYVVLLKCSQFQAIRLFGENYNIPNIPGGSQIIYHETNVRNTSWQNVTQTFVASDQYDVVWLFPKNNTTAPGVALTAWLEVALPEIRNLALCGPPPCTTLSITPVGPIDYYIPIDFDLIKLKLTSSIATGNQWFYNNQPISGATNQEYNITSSYFQGVYYSKVNGCISNSVTVNFYHYGYGFYGEENWGEFGAKMLPTGTSSFFCENTTNNLIKQFNQGTIANYFWDIITLPGYGPQYLNITPGSSSLHSNVAAVNFSTLPPIPNILPGFGYNFIQGISDLKGAQKIIDYVFYTSPFNAGTYRTCANQPINIYATQNYWNVLPGRSLFDWEDYDFGINSTIITPNPSLYPNPLDPTNIHKLHIPGRNAFTSSIQVSFSGPSLVQKKFYYNSPIGGCYVEDINIEALTPGCLRANEFINPNSNKQTMIIFPNPATNQITISSTETINYIEISDLMNPTLKRIKVNNAKSVTVNVFDLKPGIYNCKITTGKGIENQKLIIQR